MQNVEWWDVAERGGEWAATLRLTLCPRGEPKFEVNTFPGWDFCMGQPLDMYWVL